MNTISTDSSVPVTVSSILLGISLILAVLAGLSITPLNNQLIWSFSAFVAAFLF